MTRGLKEKLLQNFELVAATVIGGREGLDQTLDNRRDEKNTQQAHTEGTMFRHRAGADPFGNPGTGGYRIPSESLTGGTDHIVVEGEDLNTIAWAEADGKRYIDVASDYVAINGRKDELSEFVDGVADCYLADGSMFLKQLKVDDERRWTANYEASVWVEVRPFQPMSYSNRFKVYNTNWMVMKFGLMGAFSAVGLAGGALNTQGSSFTSLAGAATDATGATEDFQSDGGMGSITSIESNAHPYVLVFSSTKQGGGGVKVELNDRIAIEQGSPSGTAKLGSSEICVRTMEWYVPKEGRDLLNLLGGYRDLGQKDRFRAGYDWVIWMCCRLNEDHPGWIDGEVDNLGIVKGLAGEISAIMARVRDHQEQTKNYRLKREAHGSYPRRRQEVRVDDPRRTVQLPAVKIADIVGTINSMLT